GRLLMRTLAGYLSHAIADLPVDPRSIYDVVLVGNSTMRDLFFRQSVYSIGQNPYRSITEIEMAAGKRTTTSLTTTGRRSLLRIGARRSDERARANGTDERHGPVRRRHRPRHARCRPRDLFPRKRRQRARPGERGQRRRPAGRIRPVRDPV